MMRGRSLRLALTAMLLVGSTTLLACPLGYLKVLIPDYVTSDVRGLRLFRVDDTTGQLTAAGHIEFMALEMARDGEKLKYMQYDAAGKALLGPIYTAVFRDAAKPAAVQVTLLMQNQLPAGWFKVASYNQFGSSGASAGQTYVIGEEG